MIALVALTDADREELIREEVANYAEEHIRDAGWPRATALERARDEFVPVIERELADSTWRIWSARNADGATVGWLWVEPGKSPGSAFLYQITVAERFRRRGYGRAMLAALEERLAREGVDELVLNVNVGNVPAQGLYASAGYEQIGDDGRVRRMRKRF